MITAIVHSEVHRQKQTIMSRSFNRKRTGFGTVIVQGLLITLMLIVHGLFVKTFLLADKNLGDIRIQQALQFLVPIVMIFAELWLYDFIFARFTKHRS